MQKHSHYILLNTLSVFVIRAIGVALGFLVHISFARVLSQSDYGVYVYIVGLMAVLSVLSRFGFDSSLPRFLPVMKAEAKWGQFKGVLFLATLISVVISGLVGLVLLVLSRGQHEYAILSHSHLFWLLALLVPVVSLFHVLLAMLFSMERARFAVTLQMIVRPALMLILLATIYCHLGNIVTATALSVHLGALVAALLVGGVCLLRMMPKEVMGSRIELPFRILVGTSFPLLLMASFAILLSEVMVLLLGWFCPSEQVAVYGVCARIALLVAFPLQAANSVMNPLIAKLYHTGKRRELQRALSFSAWVSFGGTLVLVAGVSVFGRFALGWFGPEYSDGWVLLMILALAQLINAFAGPVGSLMKMSGQQNQSCIILLCVLLWNIGFGSTMIVKYGLIGSAITVLTAMLMWNGTMMIYVVKVLKLNPTVFRSGLKLKDVLREIRHART